MPSQYGTPRHCTADLCLIPIGTGNASVSAQVAEVQKLLAASGLKYTAHSAGTTVEGSWDEVMGIIGQAHAMLHEQGVVRISTDIRAGSRADKPEQTAEDKMSSLNKHLG